MPVLPLYKNQSLDSQSKSIDWFLYEGNTGVSWVKISGSQLTFFLIMKPNFTIVSSCESLILIVVT